MGRCERVCAGCDSAWTEYDEHVTCSQCDNQYFDDCGCSKDVTSLAGIGLVCEKCNNYNSAPTATDEDLLEFIFKKYLDRKQVILGCASEQSIRTLPCFRCKSETCKVTQENEIKLTEKEMDELCIEDDSISHFGQCCICAEKEDLCEERCVDCDPKTAKKKIKTKE